MIQRGFPQDLAVRPAHALQLDWWITQRNFINIWLPEGVFADASNCVWFLLREPTDIRWSCDAGGVWESRFTMKDRCEVVSRTREREDGIDMTVRVINLSRDTWPNTYVVVCVQLATAPDFADPRLERTWHHVNGAWRKFDPASVRKAHPGGCHFFGGMKPEDRATLSRPEIRVGSVCGRWHLSHSFPEATAVGGNCHATITCIHANPVLGALKPGESKAATGWLRVRHEPATSPLYDEGSRPA